MLIGCDGWACVQITSLVERIENYRLEEDRCQKRITNIPLYVRTRTLMQTVLSTRSHSSQSLHTFLQSQRLTVTCPVCHGCTVPSCQGADVVRQELETNILDTAHIVFTTLNSAGSQSLLQAAAFKVGDRAGARPTEPAPWIGLDTRDRFT